MRRLRVGPLASLLLFCLVAFSSCFTRWEIAASFDESKDGEKGPSGEIAHYTPNFNAFICALDMMTFGQVIWDYDDKAGFDEPPGPWNPERYVDSSKSSSGFGLATTGGYIGKGRKVFGATEHLEYLEASEAIVYMHKFSSGLLYGGAGPYVAYGLGGKVTYNGGSDNDVFGSNGYKRFDAGLHFLGEYRFNMGLSVGAGFDLGLFDKSQDPSDYTSRNRTMMVEVGYSIDRIVKGIKGK